MEPKTKQTQLVTSKGFLSKFRSESSPNEVKTRPSHQNVWLSFFLVALMRYMAHPMLFQIAVAHVRNLRKRIQFHQLPKNNWVGRDGASILGGRTNPLYSVGTPLQVLAF